MNNGAKILAALGAAATLGGCASHPVTAPPVTGIPGYAFGYKIVQQGKGTPINANVVSGAHKTWFALPSGVQLLQANGDGKPASLTRQGAYWIAPRVATVWKLYTNDGPFEAIAPESVGVVLAAQQQAKAERPRYLWRTSDVTVYFKSGAQLTSQARHKLERLNKRLGHAHKVRWVRVSGQTTPSGTIPENARIGAQRASVVVGWLTAHGIPNVKNMGWTPGAVHKSALIAARYQVRMAPPVKVARTQPRHPVVGPHPEAPPVPHKLQEQPATKPVPLPSTVKAPTHHDALTIKPKHAKHFVFETRKGNLLSQDLRAFLKRHGWSLVWQDANDFSLQYAARYEGKTLKETLKQIVQRYGVRIVLYRANHVAVVEAAH